MSATIHKRNLKKGLFEYETNSDQDFETEYQDTDDDVNVFQDDNDAECLYCAGLFLKDHTGEEWIQCDSCQRWSHTLKQAQTEKHLFVISASKH